MWDDIKFHSQTSTVCASEVWEWRGNFILHFIGLVITYPCWDLALNHFSKTGLRHAGTKEVYEKRLFISNRLTAITFSNYWNVIINPDIGINHNDTIQQFSFSIDPDSQHFNPINLKKKKKTCWWPSTDRCKVIWRPDDHTDRFWARIAHINTWSAPGMRC